jgi:hypothetical protein
MTTSLGARYRQVLLDERELKQTGGTVPYMGASMLLAVLLLAVRPDLRTAGAGLALGALYLLLSWASGIQQELSALKRRRQQLASIYEFLDQPGLNSTRLLQGVEMLAKVYHPDELARAGENLAHDFADLLSVLAKREEM